MDNKLVLGIDIGGTNTVFGLCDYNGSISYEDSVVTKDFETPDLLVKEIHKKLSEANLIDNIIGIGIGAPNGNYFSGTIEFAPNLKWKGVIPLSNLFHSVFNVPVELTNDANAAAWGEAKFGAGKNQDHVMLLTIGTGIGGGLVVNGDLHRGAFGVAAEFGHLRVVPEGHLCGCGARGCFEQYASGNALLRHAREAIAASPELARNLLARGDGSVNGLTGTAVTDAAREGDPVALAAFNTTAQWLGAGIASITGLLLSDFLKLVVIATIIGIPVAWYASSRWLQNYAYK